MKDRLAGRGVEPAIYINNVQGDKDAVVGALCTLIDSHPEDAAKILPLIAVFGKRFVGPGANATGKKCDFRWKREWRLPSISRPFKFHASDVFVGLCPDEEISIFESRFPNVKFIDPTRNVKWYATKLIDVRQRLDIKYSVV